MRYMLMAAIVGGGIGLGGSDALAATYTFATGANGNAGQSATAVFDFSDPNHFTLTLTNTGDITGIDNSLTGVQFLESGTLTSVAVNTITSAGSIDCTGATTLGGCSKSSVTVADGDWLATKDKHSNSVTVEANGKLHPYGLINSSFDANFAGNHAGLNNKEHNPWLYGALTLSFSTSGETSIPTITDLQFMFGTHPVEIMGSLVVSPPPPPPPPIPEPGTLCLLGVGIAGLGFTRRSGSC